MATIMRERIRLWRRVIRREPERRLTYRKQSLTVSNVLRKSLLRIGRSLPPRRLRTAEIRAAGGRRHRPRHAGQPAGGVAAFEGSERGGAGLRPRRGRAAHLFYRSPRARGGPALA